MSLLGNWQDLSQYASYNLALSAAVLGIAISFSLKSKWSFFILVLLSCDFILFDFLHPHIRALDPEKLWRYVIWSGSELVLCFIVYYFATVKKAIPPLVALIFTVIIIVSISALLYRLLDRHFIDLPYAYEIITIVPKYANYAKVLLGISGIFITIYSNIRGFEDGTTNHDSNDNDSGIFDASNNINV